MGFSHHCCLQIKIGKVRWQATGKFDLRGLRGEPETHARFQEIHIHGEVGFSNHSNLNKYAGQMKQAECWGDAIQS